MNAWLKRALAAAAAVVGGVSLGLSHPSDAQADVLSKATSVVELSTGAAPGVATVGTQLPPGGTVDLVRITPEGTNQGKFTVPPKKTFVITSATFTEMDNVTGTRSSG